MKKFPHILLITCTLLFGMVSLSFAQSGELGAPLDIPSNNITVDGTLLSIDGEFYVIKDMTGREVRLHVNNSTMLLGGKKQAGDMIRAEVTEDGHAIAIQ